jgi:TnpA family transposase
LTSAQISELLALPTDEPTLIRHYTLSDTDLAVIQRRRRPHNRLGFALQLFTLRYPGRLPRPGEFIPAEILNFLAVQLDLDFDNLASYGARRATRYEQLEVLRREFGYSTFAQSHYAEMQAWLAPIALTTTSGLAVARTLLEELRRRRIAAPGETVIERLVGAALLQADRHVAKQLAGSLSSQQLAAADKLLDLRDGTNLSEFAWARLPPGVVGHRSLTRLIEQVQLLRSLQLDPTAAEGVHPERLRQLAREGARLSAQHLRAISPSRRRAILVATVLEAIPTLTDAAIDMFDRLIGKLFRKSEQRQAEAFQRDARAINDKVRLFARIGEALLESKRLGCDPFDLVGAVIPWDRLAASVEEAKQLVRPDGPDYLAIATRGHAIIRQIGPLFLGAFDFRAVPAAASALRAIKMLRAYYDAGRRTWPASLPTGFIKRSWHDAVMTPQGLDRKAYEMCVFAELRDRLRAGDIWVVGSRRFRAVEDQLIARPLFEAMQTAGPLPVALPASAADYLAERRTVLQQRLAEVDGKAAQNQLADVRINEAGLKITPLRAITPEQAEALAQQLYDLVPTVRITELLAEVDGWTGFSDCFTHLHTGMPANDRRIVLTGVLADATNLGLTRMADACSITSFRQLSWTSSWHLREETYGQALALLVDAQQRQPLSAVFGTGAASSSDGQHFHVGAQGEALGSVNARHGREPAIAFYTHISDRYAPFHTKVISASAGEAAHVLDGLLYHSADLEIAIHHTDGGGVSDHVFALCALLGFRFAPRIPNLDDRRLYTFDAAKTWPTLEPFVAGRIDSDLIAAHWNDVLRLATSIRTAIVPASLMLKRLGAYPRQNGLALALREIGRIERTLFTLDWIEDPALRRQATTELNKGESKNALSRAVCFHRFGRLRDRSVESQRHRASGLNLAVAAIVLWNTVYLSRAIAALRTVGEEVPAALLGHLAPLGWQHINLTGDYLWNSPPLQSDGFRPLRQANVLRLSA